MDDELLDADDLLKDDDFLKDEMNEVLSILKEWKEKEQKLLHLELQATASQQPHTQHGNEQAYKLNSKTFTRPSRQISARAKMETQFNNMNLTSNTETLMLGLEIGGLVTNRHTSLPRGTSPPLSICTSMDNSLITSADFTNLNFLQSINSLEPMETTDTTVQNTFNDVINDRKGLEFLSMSGDGTLIKDSQIGQIDEIQLTTGSGFSTMDNSTDSVSMPNEVTQPREPRAQIHKLGLSGEMIADTELSLVDSLTSPTTEPIDVDGICTVKRLLAVQTAVLNETQLLSARQINKTFTEGCQTPEATRCDTPENVDKKNLPLQMQSTPCSTNVRHQNIINNNNNKVNNITPNINTLGEVFHFNISPIVNKTTPPKYLDCFPLNQTFEPATEILKDAQFELVPAEVNNQKFVLSTIDLLENIEQPVLDATFNKSEEHNQMQCVLDLDEGDVELLAQQDDEVQFEDMLAKLGKVKRPNAEKLKIMKSLESIKLRFQKDDRKMHLPAEQHHSKSRDVHEIPTSSHQQLLSKQNFFIQSSGSGERLLSRRSRLYDDVSLRIMHDSDTNVAEVNCNSTSFVVERQEEEIGSKSEIYAPWQDSLEPKINVELKKQDAMYVDFVSNKVGECRKRDRDRFKTIEITKEMRAQDDETGQIIVPCIDDEESEQPQMIEDNTFGKNYLTYKKPKDKSLPQRSNLLEVSVTESEEKVRIPTRSLSRPRYISRMQKLTATGKATSASAGLNSTSSNPSATTAETADVAVLKSPMGAKSKSFHNLSSNTNFVGSSGGYAPSTSRPSLDGGLGRPSNQIPNLPKVSATESEEKVRIPTRSLSRPRCISGMQKLMAAGKATSTNAGLNFTSSNPSATTAETADVSVLKSPMGVKSKSFHNLSSNINFGGGSGDNAPSATRPSLDEGLRRPSNQIKRPGNGIRSSQMCEDESTVYKVPKFVSGLRAPLTAGVKKGVGNGLARPSSGFYSLNMKPTGESETPESLSSASSRGSLYGKDTKTSDFDAQTLVTKPTQVQAGVSGIPKPSGLRKPKQIKLSGLPHPSNKTRALTQTTATKVFPPEN